MKRALALAAVAATATFTAAPATAVPNPVRCVSADDSCLAYTCPPGTKTVFHNGFNDTGPWVVICL